MSDCTKRFLNVRWERHDWHRRVTGTETITAEEPDMWARPVYRDYIRCDKEEVCAACGATRHAVSCNCDPARGDQCAIRLAYLERLATAR